MDTKDLGWVVLQIASNLFLSGTIFFGCAYKNDNPDKKRTKKSLLYDENRQLYFEFMKNYV